MQDRLSPLIDRALDEGGGGPEVATVLVLNAADLIAAYTRSEEECRALCRDLASKMETHAVEKSKQLAA